MQQAAASAYGRVAQATLSPRDLEAQLLMKSAQRLQALKDGWSEGIPDLLDALTYNRKVWTVLSTAATEPDNPLPDQIKTNIAQLAAFIFQRTIATQIEPAPEKLSALIKINRDIASGLRGRPASAQAA